MAKTMQNPQQVAQAWANNLSAATQKITQGVQSVTVSPTQLAAQQSGAYLSGVQAAVSSGKWQNSLQAVSLSQWQQATITKGVPRIATGAQASVPKMTTFMQQLLPYVSQLQQSLQSTPRGSLEQNIARMNAWTRGMAQFSKNG